MSSLYTNKIVFNKHNYIRSHFAGRGTGGPLAALCCIFFFERKLWGKAPSNKHILNK
jgi:hypothetical protein